MVQVQSVNYGNIRQTGGLADAFSKGRTRRAARNAAKSKEERLGRMEQRDIVKGENAERRAMAQEGRDVAGEVREAEEFDAEQTGIALARMTEEENFRLKSLIRTAGVLENAPMDQWLGLLQANEQTILKRGGEPNDTQEIIALLEEGDEEGARKLQQQTLSMKGMLDTGKRTKGATFTTREDDIDYVNIASMDESGQTFLSRTPFEGELVSNLGETAREQSDRRVGETLGKEFAKDTADTVANNFVTMGNLRASALNIDKAIAAIDAGGKSGYFETLVPSIRKASIALDQAQKDMGLDVVRMTTFGALSKGELDLALAIAVPMAMDEKDLRGWLVDKKEAENKLMAYMGEVNLYLGARDETGKYLGNTMVDYMVDHQVGEKYTNADEVKPATRADVITLFGDAGVQQWANRYGFTKPDAIKDLQKKLDEEKR